MNPKEKRLRSLANRWIHKAWPPELSLTEWLKTRSKKSMTDYYLEKIIPASKTIPVSKIALPRFRR